MVSKNLYKTHINLKVGMAGFRICKDKTYIGVSCDAHVSCQCCGKGVIEAKCLFKWANDHSTNWTEDERGHLDTLFSLRMNYSCYAQVLLMHGQQTEPLNKTVCLNICSCNLACIFT